MSISVKETINYIIQKIYVKKEIKPFCKNSIFTKLLRKLTQGCVFLINNRLIKEVDGCPMSGPISVTSDIYICKIEEDIAILANPIFYKKKKSFQCIVFRKFPLSLKEVQLQVNCIELRE